MGKGKIIDIIGSDSDEDTEMTEDAKKSADNKIGEKIKKYVLPSGTCKDYLVDDTYLGGEHIKSESKIT